MSDTDKLRCVERELAFRKLVYPPRVRAGKMSQREADYEIRMMEAVANDYRQKISAYSEQHTLFPHAGAGAPASAAEKD